MKTKYSKKVNEIFEAAGQPYRGNCQKRSHRALTILIDSGLVTFEVQKPGLDWVRRDETGKEIKRYNVRVIFPTFNKSFSFLIKGNIGAFEVLRVCGKALKSDTIKALIPSYVNVDSSCVRCGGQGYIRQFYYYCDGICFECYGSGYNPRHRDTVEILTPVK